MSESAKRWQVVVGADTIRYDGPDWRQADREYRACVTAAQGGESVVLLADGEILYEYGRKMATE